MKNNKGYMLVEIILASAIAFGIAIFIINLTIKLKNKNDDVLVETEIVTDQSIITNKLMDYAIKERDDFTCNVHKSSKNDHAIYYKDSTGKDELVVIVSDYATIGEISCSKDEGKVEVEVPLTVKQQPDKDYSAKVEYKYEIGDYSQPRMTITVADKKTFSKNKTATIKLTDDEGFEKGDYIIRYGWSMTQPACSNLTNKITLSIGDREKTKSKNVTISSYTGRGKIWACNENTVYDYARNSLRHWDDNIKQEDMYLDNTGPVLKVGTYSGANPVRQTATIPLILTDTEAGLDPNSIIRQNNITVSIGGSNITDFTLTNTSGANYNLKINDKTNYGEVVITLKRSSVQDKLGNKNALQILQTGIIFTNKYKITLDANEGTVAPTSIEVAYNTKYQILPTPTRGGYSFDGWFTKKTEGTKVTNDTTFDKLEDITLYAHWSPIPDDDDDDGGGGGGCCDNGSCCCAGWCACNPAKCTYYGVPLY